MKCNLGILEQVNKNSQEQFYSFNNSTQALNQYLAELDQIIKINFSD
ncbi:Uncharacterised protein [Mycoplasma putrefaciens]|nr:Uncharacterised protein [Mycoplasma putrefaciens]